MQREADHELRGGQLTIQSSANSLRSMRPSSRSATAKPVIDFQQQLGEFQTGQQAVCLLYQRFGLIRQALSSDVILRLLVMETSGNSLWAASRSMVASSRPRMASRASRQQVFPKPLNWRDPCAQISPERSEAST
jgi:hypothetical protein